MITKKKQIYIMLKEGVDKEFDIHLSYSLISSIWFCFWNGFKRTHIGELRGKVFEEIKKGDQYE